MTGYIYILSCPLTNVVRYVGQTIDLNKRYSLHLYHSKNGKARTHKEKWINSLLNTGTKPILNIIWEGDVSILDKKEIEFISLFKSFGAPLTNATLGGLTTRGRKCSDETKQKMRALMKGRFLRPPITGNEKIAISLRKKGTKLSTEQKAHLSKVRTGQPSFWTNNKMPGEFLNRIRETGKITSVPIISIKDGVKILFPSQIEAERVTGCDRKSIRDVANGKYKQIKGYIFEFPTPPSLTLCCQLSVCKHKHNGS